MTETRDPAEIAKFAALAAQWWDPHGPFAALHRMNPVRLALIRERLAGGAKGARPLAGRAGLDLGCGGGLVTAPLARLGAAMTGVDAAADAIEAARLHAAEAGLSIDYRCATAEQMAAERPASFDFVTALEVVEHVADLDGFLGACAALLKPGGVLIVSTINRTFEARALALFAAEKLLHMAPDGAHEFEKLVQPAELAMAAPGLEWEAPIGMRFDPIARTWSRGRDVSMNYFRAAVRPPR